PAAQAAIQLTATVTNPDDCGGTGEITVNTVSTVGTAAPATVLADYNLVLQDDSGNPLATLDAATNTTFAGLNPDTYLVIAQHKSFTCWPSLPTTLFIRDDNAGPRIATDQIIANSSCSSIGNGSITVSATGYNDNDGTQANFSFRWFRGADNTDPADEITTNLSGTNNQQANQLVDTTYTVLVTDLSGKDSTCTSQKTIVVGTTPVTIALEIESVNPLICGGTGEAYVSSASATDAISGTTTVDPEDFNYELLNTSFNPVTFAYTGNGRPSSPFADLPLGDYYIQGTQTTGTQCRSTLFPFTIGDDAIKPVVSIQKISDQYSNSLDNSTWTGALTVNVSVSPDNPLDSAVNNFSYAYEWYTAAEYPSGTSFSIQDTITQLDEGGYYVRATNTITNCYSYSYIYLPKVNANPRAIFAIDAPPTCFADASILLTSVELPNIPSNPADFEFRLYGDATATNPIATTSGNTVGSILFDSLAEGRYFIEVYNPIPNITGNRIAISILKNVLDPIVRLESDQYKPQQSCDPDNPNGTLGIEAFEVDFTVDDYTYLWYEGEDIAPENLIADASGSSLTGLAEGVYGVVVQNTTTGCSRYDTLRVMEQSAIPVVKVSASPNVFCDEQLFNGSVSARVIFSPGGSFSSGSSPYQYIWHAGQSATGPPLATGATLNGLGAGYYTVTVYDSVNVGCVSQSITVVVGDSTNRESLAIIQDNPQQHCDPAFANGRLTAVISNPRSQNLYNYEWFDEAGNVVSNFSIAQDLAAQVYRVVATHVLTGCILTAQRELTEEIKEVTDPIMFVNNHQTRCDEPDGTVTALIPSLISDYEFFWYDANGNSLPTQEPATEQRGLSAGIYGLQMLELRSGCLTNMVEFEIQDKTRKPKVEVYAREISCDQSTSYIRLTSRDTAFVATIEWYRNATNEVLGTGYLLNNLEADEYRYKILSSNGCTTTGYVTLERKVCVFNAVTPNGDGSHDFLEIEAIEIFPNNSVKIFNRAGTMVYQANQYNNQDVRFEGLGNWGLYTSGKQLPDGTYFYVIDRGDGSKPMTGYLELIY
ncbi:MAG: gliding motility-associated C-terminal domain-containing protein, partial [Bacteroidota bacterium]